MAVLTGVFCLFPATLKHSPHNDDAVMMKHESTATKHVAVTPPRGTIGLPRCHLVVGLRVRRAQVGGRRSFFFVRYDVEDGMMMEVQWWSDGRRCRRASAFGIVSALGERSSRDPSL